MPSEIKEKFVVELTEELKKSPHVLVTDYQGLKAEEFNELRAKLNTVGAKYKVVKNRLAKLALRNIGWSGLEDKLKGPSAMAYHGKEATSLAKILDEFSKTHQNLKFKGGHVFGQTADAQMLKTIARLPSREVLLSTLLARLNSPLQSLMMTLKEPARSLHSALSALAKKKESSPAA